MSFILLLDQHKVVLELLLKRLLVAPHPITNPHEKYLLEQQPWRKAIAINLLGTCRKIHGLGSAIFWTENTFRFTLDTTYLRVSKDSHLIRRFLQKKTYLGGPLHKPTIIIAHAMKKVIVNAAPDPSRINHIDVVGNEDLNGRVVAWSCKLLRIFGRLRCRFDTMTLTLDATLASTFKHLVMNGLPFTRAGGLTNKLMRWKGNGPRVRNLYIHEIKVILLTDKEGELSEDTLPEWGDRTADTLVDYFWIAPIELGWNIQWDVVYAAPAAVEEEDDDDGSSTIVPGSY
jgi:hypothetical protein